MKKLFLSLILIFVTGFISFAQSTEAFTRRLSSPDGFGNRVIVTEHGEAAEVVRALGSGSRITKINGYRVGIFFDNKQNAKDEAAGHLARFKELFPDVPAYMSYENPYFKVSVGNCLTRDEATILWGQVRVYFDKAVVARDVVPLSAFTDNPRN